MKYKLTLIALVGYSFTVAAIAAPPPASPGSQSGPIKGAGTPYELGQQAYKLGDYAKASLHFEEALKKTQSDPMLWYYDALCFHQLKNWSMAKSRYKTAVTYFPNSAAGKAALDALKKIDPSFVPPAAATTAGAVAAAATPAKADAPPAAGASAVTTGKAAPSAQPESAEESAKLAKEMATLPDTAHFYFKKGPQGHMEVDLMVNGHPVKALFDTGASAFFYRDQLQDAGLDLNGAKAGRKTRGWAGVTVETTTIPAKVTLGTLTRTIDIRMQDTTGSLGHNLIGQDMVKGYQYEIDDKGGRVDLKKSIALKAGEINPLYDIPIVVMGNKDVVTMQVNNKPALAFIDTGASHTIFSEREAMRLGIQSSGESVHMSGVGGDIEMHRAYVTIRIGGMMREGVPILIGGSGGCALGQDLMDGWRYKVDREHNLLRFFH